MACLGGGLGLRRIVRGMSAASLAVYVAKDRHRPNLVDAFPSARRLAAARAGPPTVQGAVRCEGAAVQPWGEWKAKYKGQLTPHRGPAAAGSGPILLQAGPFNSRWLRVAVGGGARASDVVAALGRAEEGAKTAVYVGIPDEHAHSGEIVAAVRARGYRFHHLHPGEKGGPEAPAGELIYYRWAGKGPDMVPSYSTALEGVGVIVLSPERDAVLLAWEYGHWKMITGNMDAGESMVEALRREVQEEVGLELEDGVSLLGGWQSQRNHDDWVNNIHHVFAVTAKSREAKVDGVEIPDARWFPLASLPKFEDLSKLPRVEGKPTSVAWDLGVPGRGLLSTSVVNFLGVRSQGRSLEVTRHLDREWFS